MSFSIPTHTISIYTDKLYTLLKGHGYTCKIKAANQSVPRLHIPAQQIRDFIMAQIDSRLIQQLVKRKGGQKCVTRFMKVDEHCSECKGVLSDEMKLPAHHLDFAAMKIKNQVIQRYKIYTTEVDQFIARYANTVGIREFSCDACFEQGFNSIQADNTKRAGEFITLSQNAVPIIFNLSSESQFTDQNNMNKPAQFSMFAGPVVVKDASQCLYYPFILNAPIGIHIPVHISLSPTQYVSIRVDSFIDFTCLNFTLRHQIALQLLCSFHLICIISLPIQDQILTYLQGYIGQDIQAILSPRRTKVLSDVFYVCSPSVKIVSFPTLTSQMKEILRCIGACMSITTSLFAVSSLSTPVSTQIITPVIAMKRKSSIENAGDIVNNVSKRLCSLSL